MFRSIFGSQFVGVQVCPSIQSFQPLLPDMFVCMYLSTSQPYRTGIIRRSRRRSGRRPRRRSGTRPRKRSRRSRRFRRRSRRRSRREVSRRRLGRRHRERSRRRYLRGANCVNFRSTRDCRCLVQGSTVASACEYLRVLASTCEYLRVLASACECLRVLARS